MPGVVSRAVTPEIPSFPKKIPIIGFATLITLMLAVGGVLASALLTDGAVAKTDAGSEADDRRERREPALERERFAFPGGDAAPGRWPEPAPLPEPAPVPEPVAAETCSRAATRCPPARRRAALRPLPLSTLGR